ncbi:carbohydrate-binding protein [Solihabitans fulvus]|uniref:Carbohydrate-binding protein n=1 Tax=Solihabitans fulvus TaxID=1892852 RepID=A0A5B2XME4_9PSEU|nr:carbohydrate-binding protein [Solihabitans fulvus]KAA2264071.1 carbohydrate-binding protein [Solihabitans fulvus]
MRTVRSVTVLCAALALAFASQAGASSQPVTSSQPVRTGVADLRAPIGGTVQDTRSGADARRAAGPAAAAFRDLRQRGGPRDSATRPAGSQKSVAAEQIHNFWGILPPNEGAGDGMSATHAVFPDLKISQDGDFLYAPTSKPGAGGCVEVVTSYSSYYGPQIWAWDWCGSGNLEKQVNVDSTFTATYTTTVNGHLSYSVRNVQTNAASNAWTAYLFNYRTNTWDAFFSSSGQDQSASTYGWDVFEIYSSVNPSTGQGYYCTASVGKTFESNDIKLRKNGSWVPASPADSPFVPDQPNAADYQCPALNFQVANADDHWLVSH